MAVFEEFAAWIILILFCFGIGKTIKDKTFGGTLFLIFLFLFSCFWLFPEKTSLILLNGFWFNLPYLLYLGVFGLFGLLAYRDLEKNDWGRAGLLALVGLILVVSMWFGYGSFRLSAIAHTYTPTEIKQLPLFNEGSVVHTTPEVALTAMQGGNNNSMFQPREEYLDRTVDDEGVIYIAPNTPGAFAATYAKNPGFTVLRDYKSEGYVEEIDQPQHFGEGLFWTHGIANHLYKWTWFANYAKITPVPMKNGKVLIVADKIGYHPFTNVPTWKGLKVTDGNTFSYLTPEEAQKDPRFNHRIIFPRELALKMIEGQKANKGFLSDVFPRVDKIDTDGLDANLQEVLLTQEDGSKHPYYFATVQPKNGKALIAAYLVDAQNGDFLVYHYPRVPSQVGHQQAILNIEAGSSIQPWHEEIYDVGMVQYFNAANGPFWIGSIVKTNYTGGIKQQMFVEDVVVSTEKTDYRIRFSSREALEQWMKTGEVANATDTGDIYQELMDLRKKEDALLGQLVNK